MRPAILRSMLLAALAALAPDVAATVVSSVSGGALTASSDAGDAITITCSGPGGNVLVNGANPGTGAATCASIQSLVVSGGPGGNVLSIATVGATDFPALASRTLSGGAGNDTLSGSPSIDTLDAGADIDLVDGNQGNDLAILGGGDDTFVWNPGDGSDVVDGDAGTDLLQFDGSAGSEIFAVTANGARARLARNVGNIVMDIGGVEQLRLNALGGADTATLGDLSGTGVSSATFDLAGTLGGATGDAVADSVTVDGSAGDDVLSVAAAGTLVTVSGGPVALSIANAEVLDQLVVNGLAGADEISATTAGAALATLTFDGGAGNDTLRGGLGANVLIGGDDADTILGGDGNDTAFLGAGNDRFTWNPGDDNDVVEGQAGFDTLDFNGSNVAESYDFAPNGGRFRLFRNVASVLMDCDDVERVDLAALGGADVFVLNDVVGSDVSTIDIELAGTGGAGDAAVDTVNVPGGAANETFVAFGTPAAIRISRATWTATLRDAEPANDRVAFAAGDGDDTLFASAALAGALAQLAFDGAGGTDRARAQGGSGDDVLLATANVVAGVDAVVGGATLFTATNTENLLLEGFDGNDTTVVSGALTGVSLAIDGGPGDDTLGSGIGNDLVIGGSGNDTVRPGDGNDVALLGDDDDTFVWNPGDDSDTVEGQDGVDRLLFNGSNAAEVVTVAPNGGRVLFQRDVANVLMDLDDVETVRFNALGAADTVQVNDPAGTDLARVEVDLAASGGAGDAAIDQVLLRGSASSDVHAVAAAPGGLELSRSGFALSVSATEAALDVVGFDGLAGDDVLAADVAAVATLQRLVYEGGTNFGLGDQLVVLGDDTAEAWTIQPNATRLAVSRSAGGGAYDANGVERLQLAANGGADTASTQGFAGIAQVLDGGAPASFPGDVLMVSGFAGDPSVSPIVVPGAQPIAHANFEFGPTGGRVRGRTFDDTDRDGTSGAGEPALAGLTVFDDANRNGYADAGETSAVTAPDGGYELSFPDQGSTVDVRVVRPDGRVPTSADPATITLEDDTTVSNVDFGYTPGTLIEAFPTGWQETPPNASAGTGYGYAALFEPSNEVVFVLEYAGLGSANTLSHVHGPAPRGVAAPPIIDLPASNATSGALRVGPLALTPAQAVELKAGLWYFNVHTTTFPNGEIRGQLDDALFRDSFE